MWQCSTIHMARSKGIYTVEETPLSKYGRFEQQQYTHTAVISNINATQLYEHNSLNRSVISTKPNLVHHPRHIPRVLAASMHKRKLAFVFIMYKPKLKDLCTPHIAKNLCTILNWTKHRPSLNNYCLEWPLASAGGHAILQNLACSKPSTQEGKQTCLQATEPSWRQKDVNHPAPPHGKQSPTHCVMQMTAAAIIYQFTIAHRVRLCCCSYHFLACNEARAFALIVLYVWE